MDNISIKNNIRRIRKARKITQEEMAHRLGISVTAYRDFEKGGTSIVNGNIMKLADLLETSTEEIVLGYRPSQIEGVVLEDVRKEYGGHITTLNTRIADLERLVNTLEETISSKNEIIKMLKKRLGEVE
ncbi:MAG: helix-turn-helix transcriptional regulator [Bacteroidales bacterium]|nr:helix-turn-helix transcriptional regulator [Bacteroidales bacterium]